MLQPPPPLREVGLNSISRSWLGKDLLSLTFHNPRSFYVCQVLNRAPRGCRAVRTTHLLCTHLPQPHCFLTSLFWSLGSRGKRPCISVLCSFHSPCISHFVFHSISCRNKGHSRSSDTPVHCSLHISVHCFAPLC